MNPRDVPNTATAVSKYRREAAYYDRRTRLLTRYRELAVLRLDLTAGATARASGQWEPRDRRARSSQAG